MANTYLSRTFGTPTNASKFTISVWVKRGTLGAANILMFANGGNAQNFSNLMFTGDSLFWHVLNSNSEVSKIKSSAIYRDTSGWYHVVFNWDSTQSTASNRTKMYVNGVQLDSFSTQTNSAQNTNYHINTAVEHIIGAEKGNTGGSVGNYFDGSMSHYHFIDGTTYDASAFGETDATTGEWKIKTSPSVTYGTNGFFILKDGNSVTDQSGNSNNFTVGGGTLTKTEDCPSNVFATLNPLVRHTGTVANGNTRYGTSSSSWIGIPATLGNLTGKWYWEYKLTTGAEWSQCGIVSQAGYNGILTSYVGGITNGVAMNTGGGDIYTAGGSAQAWFGSARSVGQIISVALDCDNNKIYWGTNGVWGNSSNPATGSNGYSIPSALNTDKPYFPAFSVHNCTIDINFGNGYFGTTAVASAGTNASGIGIFEYDVPTGFTALSTKGLNL